ncbi:unnamed protein product [Lymnaea stagnalis]|uniref:Uncharacterized protein n=1 Tax=Lymnaea stagnalis TaxID=6523 RepID=A0AAV2I652_LYMST
MNPNCTGKNLKLAFVLLCNARLTPSYQGVSDAPSNAPQSLEETRLQHELKASVATSTAPQTLEETRLQHYLKASDKMDSSLLFAGEAKHSSGGKEVVILRNKNRSDTLKVIENRCPNRKGKVCILGPLTDFVQVRRFKSLVPEDKAAVTEDLDPVKAEALIQNRPNSPPLFSVSSISLKSKIDEKEFYKKANANRCPIKRPLEWKNLKYHPSCFDMASDLNSVRKQISLQVNMYLNRCAKVAWSSELPDNLSNIPRHAVLVKWKLAHNLPCFTIECVYTVLGRFGDIRIMAQLSPNSAIAVYSDITTAKAVATVGIVGFQQCPLIVSWLFPEMYKDRFQLVKSIGNFHRPTTEEVFANHFRQQQKIINTCFRLHAPNMFYDHTTYRP